MKYKWDLSKIATLDKKNKSYISNKYFRIPNISCQSIELQILESTHFFEENEFIIEYLREIIKYENRINKDLQNNKEYINIYSNEDLVKIAYYFYNTFKANPKLYKAFLEVYSQRFNHLRFSRKPVENSTLGEDFYCDSKNIFIDIVCKNTGIDPYILIHEYGHALSETIFYNTSDGYALFQEIEGYFFQLLFNDLLIDNPEFIINSYPELTDNATYFSLLSFQKNILKAKKILRILNILDNNELHNLPFTNIIKLISKISLDNNLSVNEIKKLFQEDVENLSTYAISFIISIELITLYNKDPEKALSIYINTLKHEDNTSLEHLNYIEKQGIHPFDNFESYVRKLERN